MRKPNDARGKHFEAACAAARELHEKGQVDAALEAARTAADLALEHAQECVSELRRRREASSQPAKKAD